MELAPYIEDIHRRVQNAAENGGDDARGVAAQLIAPLDAALRLCLLEVLSVAAQEITRELAPASVEVRLRGREPEFVVQTPIEPAGGDAAADNDIASVGGNFAAPVPDDATMARINLRMPEHLKARVDQAAAAEGLSINAWLVRAAAAALQRDDPRRRERRGPQGGQRFTGWAR